MILATAISLYQNFACLCWDTGDFKFLFMQSFSPHVSWDTGDFKFLFMQSIYPYLLLLTSAKLNGLRMNQTLATMIAILCTITSSVVQLAAVASKLQYLSDLDQNIPSSVQYTLHHSVTEIRCLQLM